MNALPLAPETLTAYQEHRHVNVTPSASISHISSISFAKSAFYGKHWDAITTRARGLFIDNETQMVVARGYDKFFNLGERPETQVEYILDNFQFPVEIWHKYNGFLGITGYDDRTAKLLIGSKSRLEGEFATMFREIITEQLGAGTLERLRRALRDLGASAIFEVIDPVRDPHIVEYDRPHVVLLDVVRRHAPTDGAHPDRLSHAELKQFAAHIAGSAKVAPPVKERIVTIKDRKALESFIASYLDPTRERRIEGVIIESANGDVVKLKSPWYSRWKRARGHIHRFVECHDKQVDFDGKVEEEHQEFLAWAFARPVELLRRLSIIDLRNAWQQGTDIDHLAEDQERADESARLSREERKAAERDESLAADINKVATKFAADIAAGKDRSESLAKLIERGKDSPVIKAALEGHPEYALLAKHASESM